MNEEQIDRVEIDGRQYIVTNFTADDRGGSFRAIDMLAPHPEALKGLLHPGGVLFSVEGSTNDFGYTEIRFRFGP